MYKLSERSLNNLKGVDNRLVAVVKRAIEITEQDFIVIEGLRTKARQAELVKKGASKTMNSRHLVGKAVDIVPAPVDWNDLNKFGKIAKAMFQAAKEQGITLRWGADWNMNGRTDDEKFIDCPHFELPQKIYG